MPFGGEGTKTHVDLKEGFYGGGEHSDNHPLAGAPTHGTNTFPSGDLVPGMHDTVLEYIEAVTTLGTTLCDALSVGLGLEKKFIRNQLLEHPEPVQLFRSFHYVGKEGTNGQYGIGEHTDFGLLTILSPHGPGLQICLESGEWIDVPYLPGSFVVNVGDILDRLSSGVYCSRPHRVLPPEPNTDRLSIPFFFDPAWNAKIQAFPLDTAIIPDQAKVQKRWDKTTFRGLEGVWGNYLAVKVKKVFPDLQVGDFAAVSRESMRHRLAIPKEPITEVTA